MPVYSEASWEWDGERWAAILRCKWMMASSYDLWLVALSIAIAIVASYTALDLSLQLGLYRGRVVSIGWRAAPAR